jgi:hypothetical protein
MDLASGHRPVNNRASCPAQSHLDLGTAIGGLIDPPPVSINHCRILSPRPIVRQILLLVRPDLNAKPWTDFGKARQSQVGFIFKSPWIVFEAGAITNYLWYRHLIRGK